MPKFVTGQDLENAIFDTIQNAKEILYIVSPFIKLDEYFKEEVFDCHKSNPHLHVVIVFGKNSSDVKRSLKSEDFDYFRQFPNISVVYVPNLHAKYYANEKTGVLTSINLYDYSFKNNIEFGVVGSTNILGQPEAFDSDAFEAVRNTIMNNSAVLVRRPIFKKKIFKRTYIGSENIVDNIKQLLNGIDFPRVCVFDYEDYLSEVKDTKKGRLSRFEFDRMKNIQSFANEGAPLEIEKLEDPTADQEATTNQEIISLKPNQGVCISCRKVIERNSDKPYCYECFGQWRHDTGQDEDHTEHHCHTCSAEAKTSLRKPDCYTCYKSGNVVYPYRFDF